MLLADTVRECCRRTLAGASEPMPVSRIADLVNTDPRQAGRALRQLEAEGAAVRQAAAGGCYAWSAVR